MQFFDHILKYNLLKSEFSWFLGERLRLSDLCDRGALWVVGLPRPLLRTGQHRKRTDEAGRQHGGGQLGAAGTDGHAVHPVLPEERLQGGRPGRVL